MYKEVTNAKRTNLWANYRIEFESLRKICQRKSAEPDVLRTYCFECPAMWVPGRYIPSPPLKVLL